MNIKLLVLLLLLNGCSLTNLNDSKSSKELPRVENRTNQNNKYNSNSSTAVINQDADQSSIIVKGNIDQVDPNKLFDNYSVYFDLDEYTIQEKYMSTIKQHAEFLTKHPNHFVFIEGHTDERGGAEYNLALGQKRSDAIKRLLIVYGVKETQLEAYSYGKEKPKALGSNEEAWSQNRRVDLYYRN